MFRAAPTPAIPRDALLTGELPQRHRYGCSVGTDHPRDQVMSQVQIQPDPFGPDSAPAIRQMPQQQKDTQIHVF